MTHEEARQVARLFLHAQRIKNHEMMWKANDLLLEYLAQFTGPTLDAIIKDLCAAVLNITNDKTGQNEKW